MRIVISKKPHIDNILTAISFRYIKNKSGSHTDPLDTQADIYLTKDLYT